MPQINWTAKEILILIHAIRIAVEYDELKEFARKGEIEAIRNKLQNVKDV
jgi:hypothetical protein